MPLQLGVFVSFKTDWLIHFSKFHLVHSNSTSSKPPVQKKLNASDVSSGDCILLQDLSLLDWETFYVISNKGK